MIWFSRSCNRHIGLNGIGGDSTHGQTGRNGQSLIFLLELWLYSSVHSVPAFLPTVPQWQLNTSRAVFSLDPAVSLASSVAHSSVPVAEQQHQNNWARCALAGHERLSDFPPQPQCHYVLLEEAADEKRESVLRLRPGAPQQILLGPCRHDCAGRRGESGGRRPQSERRHVEQPNGNFLLVKKT